MYCVTCIKNMWIKKKIKMRNITYKLTNDTSKLISNGWKERKTSKIHIIMENAISMRFNAHKNIAFEKLNSCLR